jgi:hypothetical protein
MTTALEAAVTTLTTETTALLDTCTALKTDVASDIAAAVVVSENAAQIPLAQVAVNLIDTQTLLVTLITESAT